MAASMSRIAYEKFLLKSGLRKNILCGSYFLPNLLINNPMFCSDSSNSDDKKEVEKFPTNKSVPKEYEISKKKASVLSDVKLVTSIPPEKNSKPLNQRREEPNKEDERLKEDSSSSSSDSSSSDDEKEVKKISPTKSVSKKYKISEKLASVLSDIKIETSIPPEKSSITLKLAKPLNHRRKELIREDERFKRINPTLTKAVKEVATSLGGDVTIIESELLSRLKSHADDDKGLIANSENEPVKDISNVFVGMKVEKQKSKPKVDHTNNKRFNEQGRKFYPAVERKSEKFLALDSSKMQRVNIYQSRRLGIFEADDKEFTEDIETSLWNELQEHELQLLVTHPPKNAFEEMICWTEQGKLWKFPIDNEQGMDEEKKVGFEEHVFLEYLLEGFPTKGPIRHFMELVIVGLSKNPYITVERKKEHVEWYRQYFKDKEEVLLEVDAAILQ